MQQSENPYASPQSLQDPAVETRIQSLKWLRGAGAGLLIMGAMEAALSVISIIMQSVLLVASALLQVRTPNPIWLESLIVLFAVVTSIRAYFMIIGSRHMREGRNYRSAYRSAVIAILGIVYPLFWLDVVFGVWALILLRKDKYKALFEHGPAAKPNKLPTAAFVETS